MWVWSILGLVWCCRECPLFISEFVDMGRYICLCIIPSFVCVCVSVWVESHPSFLWATAEAWETVEHQVYNITVCVLCEVWAEAEETAQSIAQQPYGSTLMRLMCVWSRNKERDQAAHCMMGLWLVYIYIYIYICRQRVMSSVQHFSGEGSGFPFLHLGISAFIITFPSSILLLLFLEVFYGHSVRLSTRQHLYHLV